MEKNKPVGEIEYYDGTRKSFYSTEEYIKAFKEAMEVYCVSGGFKATTLTRDPVTRKAYDDAIYNEFGEDNPHDLEHYARTAEAPIERQPELDEEMEL